MFKELGLRQPLYFWLMNLRQNVYFPLTSGSVTMIDKIKK